MENVIGYTGVVKEYEGQTIGGNTSKKRIDITEDKLFAGAVTLLAAPVAYEVGKSIYPIVVETATKIIEAILQK